MSDAFEANVQGPIPVSDIPSLTNGGATRVQDDTLAKGLTAAGVLAERAAKNYLKAHAAEVARDARAIGEVLLNPDAFANSKTSISEQVAKGEVDGFTVKPDAVKEALDKIDKLDEGRRQKATNAEKINYVMQAEINKVKAIAPGWAEEVQKYAADKLGFDPGGYYMKLAMQRETAMLQQQMSTAAKMEAAGYPQTEEGYQRYLRHNRMQGEAELAQAQLNLVKTRMDTALKAAQLAGASEEEQKNILIQHLHENVRISSEALNKQIYEAKQEGLRTQRMLYDAHGRLKDTVPVYDEQGNEIGTQSGVEALTQWKQQASTLINNLEASLVQMRAGYSAQGVKPDYLNQSFNGIENSIKQFRSVVEGLSPSDALNMNNSINIQLALSNMAAKEPAVYSAMAVRDLAGAFSQGAVQARVSNILLKSMGEYVTDENGNIDEKKQEQYVKTIAKGSKPISEDIHMNADDAEVTWNRVKALSTLSDKDFIGEPPEVKDTRYNGILNMLGTNADEVQTSHEYQKTFRAVMKDGPLQRDMLSWLATQPPAVQDMAIERLAKAGTNMATITAAKVAHSLESFDNRGEEVLFQLDETGDVGANESLIRSMKGMHRRHLRTVADVLDSGMSAPSGFVSATERQAKPGTYYTDKARLLIAQGLGQRTMSASGVPLVFNRIDGAEYRAKLHPIKGRENEYTPDGRDVYVFDGRSFVFKTRTNKPMGK